MTDYIIMDVLNAINKQTDVLKEIAFQLQELNKELKEG